MDHFEGSFKQMCVNALFMPHECRQGGASESLVAPLNFLQKLYKLRSHCHKTVNGITQCYVFSLSKILKQHLPFSFN